MMNKSLLNNFPRTSLLSPLLCPKVSYAVQPTFHELKAKSTQKRIQK